MSLLSTIEKLAPKAWKPFNFVLLGNNPARRVERASISVAVIATILVGVILAASGVQIFANGVGSNMGVVGDSCSVRAAPSSVQPGGTFLLDASISHFIPKTTLTLTITVSGPPGTSSKAFTLTTNAQGYGHVNTLYPDSFAPSSSASTKTAGTYHVSAVFFFVYGSVCTAKTTFTVKAH